MVEELGDSDEVDVSSLEKEKDPVAQVPFAASQVVMVDSCDLMSQIWLCHACSPSC